MECWRYKANRLNSRKDIATIKQDIASRHVARSIAGEIKIQSLGLLYMALPTKRRHAISLVDRLRACAHFGVKESRGDDVDARKVPPLASKRLAKVRDESLGRIVHWLVYGHVDNVCAHTRGDDQVPCALALKHLAGVLCA